MKKKKTKFEVFKFLASITITEGVGIVSSLATTPKIPTWYATLNKPFFNPPNWLFGPVWTILYFLMGVSLYLVWTKGKRLFWFWIQLSLNFLWSFVFFAFQSPEFAFIIIVLMWLAIVKTIVDFWKVDRIASLILFPYLGWVSFASLLNLAIAILN